VVFRIEGLSHLRFGGEEWKWVIHECNFILNHVRHSQQRALREQLRVWISKNELS
jgi:hypothetical protein